MQEIVLTADSSVHVQENQALIGQKVSEEQIAKEAAAEALIAESAAKRKQEEADRAARNSSWSADEKRLLEKALIKYPVVCAADATSPSTLALSS